MAACKACFHKEAAEIDRQMVAGIPFRTISARFHLSLGGLHRHKSHIQEILAQAAHRESPERASELLGRVEEVVAEAKKIVEAARSEKSFQAATMALNTVLRSLELIGRLSGELEAANSGGIHFHASKTVNINVQDNDLELAQLIGEATGNFSIDEFLRLKALVCSPPVAPEGENPA